MSSKLPFIIFALIGFLLPLHAQKLFYPGTEQKINFNILNSPENTNAAITLTQIPTKFFRNNDSTTSGNITIAWEQSGIFGDLYISRFPNVTSAQYPRRLIVDNTNSDKKTTFNVGWDSVKTGIYYCIIFDRFNQDSTSAEFNIIVEHHLSAKDFSPRRDIDTTNTGNLSWSASSPYTPFYHLIVSNRPMMLKDTDGDGDDEVIGINVIYQAITSNTYINYRDADPSGFFNNTKSPRLASGNKYYWLLFNNYGNNPALSSDVISYSEVPRFVYWDELAFQPAPQNISPVNAGITNLDTLEFRWHSVPGSNYHLYLYEENEERGSVGSFLIYDTTIVTGDTSVIIDRANQLLVNTNYYWNVTAENGVLFSASRVDSFAYSNVNSGQLNIHTKLGLPGTPALARVNLYIQLVGGPPSTIIFLTDESGNFERELIDGKYQVIATKEGFEPVDTTITITAKDTTDLVLILNDNPTYFTGRIQIPSNTVVPKVRLLSNTANDTFSVFGNLRYSGTPTSEYTFRANVQPGDWTLFPFADGFRAVKGDTVNTTIQFGDYIETPIFDLEEIPSQIKVNVTDSSGNSINDFYLTFKKGANQQTIFVSNPPYFFAADPGTWTVMIEKEGYFSQLEQYEVEIAHGQTYNLDIVLIKAGNLRGVVRDDLEQPLDLVNIQALPQNGSAQFAQTTSSMDGSFGPLLLKPGSYHILAQKNGYSSADTFFTIIPNEIIYYNPVLVKNRSAVQGIVSDNSGTPLSGAKVNYILGFGGGFSPPTDSTGSYLLAVPSNVSIKVFASKTGYATSDTVVLNVPENQTVHQNFSLLKLNSIVTGTVQTIVQSQLTPVSNAIVSAIDTTTKQLIYTDSTNQSGKYKVYTDAGTYWIKVFHEIFITQQDTIILNSGDSLNVDFILNKNYGSVSGTVLTSTLDLVPNQIIVARPDFGTPLLDTTNVKGEFSFTELEPRVNYNFSTTKVRYFTNPSGGYTYRVKPGVDTTGFNFTLTRAQITSLQILDVGTKFKLPNTEPTQFNYQAYDGSKKVEIEPPLWHVEYPDTLIFQTAKFNENINGLFEPKIDALDARFSISVEDTASSIKEIISGFSIYSKLNRQMFINSSFEIKDHTGFILKIDSTDIDPNVGITINLSREVVPGSKAISTEAESYGDSYNLTTQNSNFLSPTILTLPIPKQVSTEDITRGSQVINLGVWNDNFLEWEVLKNSNVQTIPYFMVSNNIDGDGEYIVLITSQPLGIHKLKILPNPFSPNLINFNDPFNRGLTGQVIAFELTSLDIRRPFVSLRVYNMNGELVRNLAEQEPMMKGQQALIWDGRTNTGVMARNGRYIVHLKVKDSTGEKEEIKTSVLIK